MTEAPPPPRLSFVIPVHNEAGNVGPLHEELDGLRHQDDVGLPDAHAH